MVRFFEFLVIILSSLVFHELGHAYLADRFGDDTSRNEGRLTLNPLKHLSLVGSLIVPLVVGFLTGFFIGWAKPVIVNPENFRQEWKKYGFSLVALAGPSVNLIIAFVASLIYHLLPLSTGSTLVSSFLLMVVFINIVLCVFNLIPFPPLDGFNVFYPLFSENFKHFIYSNFLFLIFMLFFLVWPLVGPPVFNIMGHLFTYLTGVDFSVMMALVQS